MPVDPIPVRRLSREALDALDPAAAHIVRLGHSSHLLKLQGRFWLIDPMFSERASPLSFAGPLRCASGIHGRNITMAKGTVKWFNETKGYGFIAPSDGSADVFAHFSAIAGSGRRDLYEGQQVEFDTERGQKGLQATNIRAL